MIAFGISSLFFAILGVVVPSWGIFISGLSGFLAWMSAGRGVPLSIAAVIINLVNIFLFSPSYMLVVGMESQYRTPDQNKILYIWMVVLFLQISAIGVHLVNYLVDKIDFGAIKRAFKKKKRNTSLPRGNEPKLQDDSNSTHSKNIGLLSAKNGESVVSLSLETPICQTYGETKEAGDFSKSDSQNNRKLEDIPFAASRPHSKLLVRNRTLLKAYAIVISFICLAFLLVFFYPVVSMQKKREGNTAQSLPDNSKGLTQPKVIPPAPTRNKSVESGGYWYVIELKSGETILTQDAVITKNFVTVPLMTGKERRIDKKDLNSFRRTKI